MKTNTNKTKSTNITSSSTIPNLSIGWSTELPEKVSDKVSWIKLASFGLYTHPQGIQRMTVGSCNEIVHYFYSLRGRFSRRFRGLRVHLGHPQYPDLKHVQSSEKVPLFGHIIEIATQHDGLWAKIRWTDKGLELAEKTHVRFISPLWILRAVHTDVFEPCKLVSAGVTYDPTNLVSKKPSSAPRPIKDIIPAKSITEGLAVVSKKTNLTKEQLLFRVYENMRNTGDSYLNSWKKITRMFPECATIYISDKDK